jgi:pimeloyl-ACP methyl ester carboxylesterase
MAAWRWGSGPTVFLAHGWEGFGAQLAAFVAPLEKAGYSVVTFDAKAHGATAGVEATLSDFADALLALQARFGRPRAVIAHSFGALGALLALQRGLAPSALALVAIPSPRERVAAFRTELRLSDAATEKMVEIIEQRVGVPFEGVEAPVLASGVALPVLVVHDRRDRVASRATAEATVAALSNATLRTTEGLGHHRILKDPTIVADITSFLEANDVAVEPIGRAVEIPCAFAGLHLGSKRRHPPVTISST